MDHNQLDRRVLPGDGTNTVAKNGGNGMGYSGHKHQKGETVLATIDTNGYVLAPLPVAPVNEADTVKAMDLSDCSPMASGSNDCSCSRGR